MELFKYFEKREFAKQFLAGVVSMNYLASYRDVERAEEMGGARFDREEGTAKTYDGVVTSHKDFGNLIRVLCCSMTLSERLKTEFGEFVVRISDADAFGLLLANSVEDAPFAQIGMQHQSVSYGGEPICISDYVFVESQSFTKPAGYSYQCEYRYAFVERDELRQRDRLPTKLENPLRRELKLPAGELNGLLERLF